MTGRRRLRLRTGLLVGWCVGWAGWIPAAVVRLPRCPYGESWCDRTAVLSGTPSIAAYLTIAVLGALALLALWWWDRRRAAPGVPTIDAEPTVDVEPTGRRVRPAILVLGGLVGVLGAAHLMLFAPAASVPDQCTVDVHLNSAMSYCLNVDSGDFLRLAHHPRLLLQPRAVRQARPGYVALSVIATRTIGPVASGLGIDRLYGQSDPAYVPLVLFNFGTAMISILLLAWLLLRLGTPTWTMAAICAFLAVNDIVKAFIWTPHQDLFTLFVPVLTIFVAQWVIRTDPPWWKLALVGLGLGTYSLIYASVIITIAVVSIVLLARGWRGIARTAVFAAAFAALPLIWITVCRIVVGSYYNHEVVTYHEFVWVFAEARHGPHALMSYTGLVSLAATRELASVAGLTLVVIAGLAAAAVRYRIDLVPRAAAHRAILISAALTVAVSVAFGWGIGYFTNRMMFNAVPALLVVLGWLAARLSARSSGLRVATATILSLIVLVVIGVTVATPGPWS